MEMNESPVHANLGNTPYQVKLSDGRHTWHSDVPEAQGGGDAGPSPHQLLMAALAACTSITVDMYARRKGWPLTEIDVDVAILEEKLGPQTRLHLGRDIRLSGPLDDAQRQRLLEIANVCPIHKILGGDVSVSSQLVTDSNG
jgi:putative redox protein